MDFEECAAEAAVETIVRPPSPPAAETDATLVAASTSTTAPPPCCFSFRFSRRSRARSSRSRLRSSSSPTTSLSFQNAPPPVAFRNSRSFRCFSFRDLRGSKGATSSSSSLLPVLCFLPPTVEDLSSDRRPAADAVRASPLAEPSALLCATLLALSSLPASPTAPMAGTEKDSFPSSPSVFEMMNSGCGLSTNASSPPPVIRRRAVEAALSAPPLPLSV